MSIQRVSGDIREVLASLGISPELISARGLILCGEAEDLVVVATDDDGREHRLAPSAAVAWHEMHAAARSDGVSIRIVSGFRSVDRQAQIVRAKLARGLALDAILCVSAPPGYSEHHSGSAVDVTTDGVAALDPGFENTPAFQWLSKNASRFGFLLSFPANNPYGYAYEPWHWCHKEIEV